MNERDIFMAALQLDDAQRIAYLDGVCGTDSGVRQRVDALMQAFGEAGSFLEQPAAGSVATLDHPPAELPGTMIGPYKLLEQIGEGGMGLVYMAEQQRPMRRLVALKIIKPGMDSRQVIARFEAEKQALAMMDHPNIAKVFEAGTVEGARARGWGLEEPASESLPPALVPSPSLSSGRPYFAMELVRGIPINEFCDQKRLTVRERLELFIQVCQAVQHAHQKGIIHRDLKPTNVLVTMHDTVAVPKVIDFGIAKALQPPLPLGEAGTTRSVVDECASSLALAPSPSPSLHTGFAQLVGTPLYMSPEQAEMNQLGVDTRSDVYSLGVLLYELLTGTTPFDKDRLKSASFDEMRRIIREEEPETVSARLARTRSRVGSAHRHSATGAAHVQSGGHSPPYAPRRNELDWIVMKALEKERSDRYESASSLARDIERFLHDEPVQACPPTAAYRFRKFARRHRAALTTALLVAASLLIGTALSAWQAVRATQAEAQANANEVKAEQKAQEASQQRDAVQALNEKLRATQAELRDTVYAAHTNLAHNAWEANNLSGIRILVERCVPKPGEDDLRHFEWYYLQRLSHPELLTIKGHTASVLSVAYSPDGTRLASASQDQTVKVWDSQTGQELLSLSSGAVDPRFTPDGKPLHDDIDRERQRAEYVAFSPDGQRLASGRKVWDAHTGQELVAIQGHGWIRAFSPDGKRLAGSGYRGAPGNWEFHVVVWDALTGAEVQSWKGHTDQIDTVAYSPHGKRIASNSLDRTVKVWDAETGRELLTYKGHIGTVRSLAFSPDGKHLASGPWERVVKIWEVDTGNDVHVLTGHTAAIKGLAFSPDGQRLASASSDGTVKIWNPRSGEERLTLKGHWGQVHHVAFSPDGQRVASASSDQTVRVWDANRVSRADITVKGDADRSWGLAFSPDGKRIASGGSKRDDAKQFLVGPEVKIWDAQTTPGAETGKNLLVLNGHTADVWSVAFSPDGKRVASGSVDKTIKIWDALTGDEVRTLKGHTGPVRTVVCSPDGRQLATAADDKTVKVWDLETGDARLTLQGTSTSGIFMATKGLAFSPDGRRLAAGSDDTVRIWDVANGREVCRIGSEGPRLLFGLAFSPDGRYLARTSNNRVKIWDTQTGQDVRELAGHKVAIMGLAFSPDGKRLASACQDGTVKIWNPQSGQETLTLTGHSQRVYHVAFSPDGHRLATNGMDGTVRIWDATPLPEKP